jgi:spermidine/putrescine transport system ATP-binding protein
LILVVPSPARHERRPPVTQGRQPKLLIDDVRFAYGEQVALTGVSLAVAEGEFISLLGPSGCGKTTLLRIIAGLLRPGSGRIVVDGVEITHLPPERRGLNMVFQHLALFPHLSVGDNVGFGLKLRGLKREEIGRRALRMLDLVGLRGLEDRSTHELSGGQQQRVALARALVTEPSILLLDEPLGALDFAIRKEMQEELKALQRRLNVTFVFVTHDQTEAMAMSDRVVLMNNGSIVQDASPFDAYSHPVDVFAATFVGETNLLSARVVARSPGSQILEFPGSCRLELPPTHEIGTSLVVSIRPEHMTIVHGDATAAGHFAGTIMSESFYGADVIVEVQTAAGRLKVREPARAAKLGRLGDYVQVDVDVDRIRVFEP